MENLLDTPTIDTKSRELCQFIVDQPEFAAARGHIEAFLENAEAQAVYRAWQEKGQELQRMSHEGLQPNDDDIKQMEALRETVMKNEIASDFAEAESQMNVLVQRTSAGQALEGSLRHAVESLRSAVVCSR